MKTRKSLHEKLCSILGTKNVYFRSPSIGMKYPCIKYELIGDNTSFADNKRYIHSRRWKLTIMDEDPDSEIPERLQEVLSYCKFDRLYEVDGLNHFVFTLLY